MFKLIYSVFPVTFIHFILPLCSSEKRRFWFLKNIIVWQSGKGLQSGSTVSLVYQVKLLVHVFCQKLGSVFALLWQIILTERHLIEYFHCTVIGFPLLCVRFGFRHLVLGHLKTMMKMFTLKIQYQTMTQNFVIKNLRIQTNVGGQDHQDRMLKVSKCLILNEEKFI